MYPLESGQIFIDSEDIANISLFKVRRSMAIIPQDPVLFMGTLRFNVDPEEIYTDEQIWECMERIGLKDTVFVILTYLSLKIVFRFLFIMKNYNLKWKKGVKIYLLGSVR